MKKQYGFIYVERYDDGTGDFSRRKKRSFDWYRKVIASNGEDLSDCNWCAANLRLHGRETQAINAIQTVPKMS